MMRQRKAFPPPLRGRARVGGVPATSSDASTPHPNPPPQGGRGFAHGGRLVTILLLLTALPCWAADLAAGRGYYDSGDWKHAMAELAPLAERGDAEAQFLVGAMLLDGSPELAVDRAGALRWLTRAGEQGHPKAQYELFMAYSDRNEQSKAALDWAARLAAQGRRLDGIPREQAAVCAAFLGQQYLRGWSVPRDAIQGRAWLVVAQSLGSAEAKAGLAQLDPTLTPDDIARSEEQAKRLAP